jgi:Fe-S-cluster containining protein
LKKLRISKGPINRFLPASLQLNQGMNVLYEEEIFQFRCNNCGRCCDLHENQNTSPANPFAVVLCDLDIKRLARLDESLLGFTNPATIRNTEDTVIFIPKIDEKCPFYDREDHLCEIYDKRPLVCRVFPYIFEMRDVQEFQVRLNPEAPCPSECFNAPLLTPKEVAKVFIWGFVLEKRQKLAHKIWQQKQEGR